MAASLATFRSCILPRFSLFRAFAPLSRSKRNDVARLVRSRGRTTALRDLDEMLDGPAGVIGRTPSASRSMQNCGTRPRRATGLS